MITSLLLLPSTLAIAVAGAPSPAPGPAGASVPTPWVGAVELSRDSRAELFTTEANGDATRWRFDNPEINPEINKPVPPERFRVSGS